MAPVGLGAAAGRPPELAQVPTATTASEASRQRRSRLRLSSPAMVEQAPASAVGTEPSTTSNTWPAFSFKEVSRAASAAAPEAACKVWW
jgi:hypothetical protein